jgi:hypothetical protein
MFSANLQIHNVGIDFISNSKEVFYAVKSEMSHAISWRPQIKKDKVLYFWKGNEKTAPTPLKRLIYNKNKEQVNSNFQTLVNYGNLNMGVLAKGNYNHDEAVLVCVSLIGYLVRFALFRRVKAVGFHAASFAWRNKGVLLPGTSGAGKTTLSYFFTQAGFKFLSDEETIVQRNSYGMEILGLPRRLRLDELFFRTEEGRKVQRRFQVSDYAAFGEKGYCLDLRNLRPKIYQRKAGLKLICVLANEEIAEPVLNPLDKEQAMHMLIESFESVASYNKSKDSVNGLLQYYNSTGFTYVEKLVEKYPVYHLRYDIEKHGRQIPELIKSFLNNLNNAE